MPSLESTCSHGGGRVHANNGLVLAIANTLELVDVLTFGFEVTFSQMGKLKRR